MRRILHNQRGDQPEPDFASRGATSWKINPPWPLAGTILQHMKAYKKIILLHREGYSNAAIAREVKCARGTVIDILKRAERTNLVDAELSDMSDIDIYRRLHAVRRQDCKRPEMGEIIFRLGLQHNSINKEYQLYKQNCESKEEKPYSKSSFSLFIKATGQLNTTPYTSRMHVTILSLQENDKTVSVVYAELDYAGGSFAIVMSDSTPRTWINANKQILSIIGGTPDEYVFVGHMPKRFATETQNFCNYYDMKLTLQKNSEFGRRFLSLYQNDGKDILLQATDICRQLNAEPLYTFSPFSHADATKVQSEWLRRLKPRAYETTEVKHPTVQVNFHVFLEGHYYSVPFEFRHERIKVVITDTLIEMYVDDAMICVHDRVLREEPKYVTIPEHMPPDERIPWNETSGRSLRAWAKEIGFPTFQVVDLLLKRSTVEPQAYKSCIALLSAAKRSGSVAVNNVCREALIDKANRLHIHWILSHIDDRKE